MHGTAQLINTAAPEYADVREMLIKTYGDGWEGWGGQSQYARIEPRKMFAVRMH